MSLRDLLKLVSEALSEAEVPHMLTGSLAGSFHGAPRATQDIDLVIEAPLKVLLELAAALRDAGLYVSDDAVREAHRVGGMFNAIDPNSGWKIDFILRKDRDFSESEFLSRRQIELWGTQISVVTAEDIVVAKLEWAQMGDSERQVRDVAEILRVQGGSLDRQKIERWVAELGLADIWSKATALAGEG